MVQILYVAFLTLVGGILGRLGGTNKGTAWRDWGVPSAVTFALLPTNFIGLFLSFGLLYGVLTMGYGGEGEPKEDQSFLYRVFGKEVFYVLGFLFGLTALPYAIFSGHIILALVRCVILAFLVHLIHEKRRPILRWDSAQVEEFLRYSVLVLSTLLIGGFNALSVWGVVR